MAVWFFSSDGNLIKRSNGLEFFYDHTGVFAVKHNNATYFYRKNAQNDIISLLDNSGTVVVKYKYDAWGKCQTTVVDSSATTIAELNPFDIVPTTSILKPDSISSKQDIMILKSVAL